MKYSLEELTEHLGCNFSLKGRMDAFGTSFSSIFDATLDSISWLRSDGADASEIINKSVASIIICSHIATEGIDLSHKALILVENPQVAYMRLMKNIEGRATRPSHGFHSTALISPFAIIGQGTSIGPYAVIGDCVVGEDCTIESHTVIHNGVEIRNNVLISNHCNIGGEGFGFILNEVKELENMVHIGAVFIDDDVSIFPYTNVDRSTLGITRIGRGTKIDHYCHIGHNSSIGENSLVTANVTLLGSSRVGNRCTIGSGSILRDGVHVGDGVTVGMSSVITKDIPDYETWVGSPARPIAQFKVLQHKIRKMLEL
jgi:UDP-3-O-[3-hydroxymyristoyl] glucosamine N-acyltransferase